LNRNEIPLSRKISGSTLKKCLPYLGSDFDSKTTRYRQFVYEKAPREGGAKYHDVKQFSHCVAPSATRPIASYQNGPAAVSKPSPDNRSIQEQWNNLRDMIEAGAIAIVPDDPLQQAPFLGIANKATGDGSPSPPVSFRPLSGHPWRPAVAC
jgi:hypothetical protein